MTGAAFRAPLKRSIWSQSDLTAALVRGAFLLTHPIVRRLLAERHAHGAATHLLQVARRARVPGLEHPGGWRRPVPAARPAARPGEPRGRERRTFW